MAELQESNEESIILQETKEESRPLLEMEETNGDIRVDNNDGIDENKADLHSSTENNLTMHSSSADKSPTDAFGENEFQDKTAEDNNKELIQLQENEENGESIPMLAMEGTNQVSCNDNNEGTDMNKADLQSSTEDNLTMHSSSVEKLSTDTNGENKFQDLDKTAKDSNEEPIQLQENNEESRPMDESNGGTNYDNNAIDSEQTLLNSFIEENFMIPNDSGKKISTDAFGEIKFQDNKKTAKFLRLAEDTNPELVVRLLTKHWEQPPGLVISIIGSQNIKMKHYKRDLFRRAIKEATNYRKHKKTWILTNGINCGVSGLVARALQHHDRVPRSQSAENQPLCIGIAPWGIIADADRLKVKGPQNPVDYDCSQEVEDGKHVPLTLHHSHFLLVDDGQPNNGGEVKLRAGLEKALLDAKIPVVIVMVQGNEDTIQYVCNSARENIPVILCKYSEGGAYALSKIINGTPVEYVSKLDEIGRLVRNVGLDYLKDTCMTYNHMFTLYSLMSNMEQAIGIALLDEQYSSDKQDRYRRWMKRKFKKKDCCTFIASERDKHVEVEHTGLPTTEDEMSRIQTEEDDTEPKKQHYVSGPTDAFGDILFVPKVNNNGKTSKFVRLSDETRPGEIIDLLQREWSLPVPNLVLSVIGGSKHLQLSEEGLARFKEALEKVFNSTSSWILTNGTNCGVTKCIGDVVKDGQLLNWDEDKPVNSNQCVGIAPWGYVDNSDSLVIKDNQINPEMVHFHAKPLQRGQPVSLNPHHTHFILVDDGRKTYGADLKLRLKLEKAITYMMTYKDQIIKRKDVRPNDVPFVLIVLEGGYDAINHVLESLKNNRAVVVCDKTGRAADILSYVHKRVSNERTNGEETPEEIRESFENDSKAAKEAGEEMKQLIDRIDWKYLCEIIKEKQKIITVCDMGDEGATDMNAAILDALLCGDNEKSTMARKMDLAILWNRYDLAENLLNRSMDSWTDTDNADDDNMLVTEDRWKTVMLDDKLEFLKLFVDYMAFIKTKQQKGSQDEHQSEFFTENQLVKLYNEGNVQDFRRWAIKIRGRKARVKRTEGDKGLLEDIRHLARLETQCENENTDGTYVDKVQRTEHEKRSLQFLEVFLWATLSNKSRIAEYCWEQVQNPISAAIAASKLLKKVVEHTRGLDQQQILATQATKYRDLATGVLDECYHTNKILARDVVERRHRLWKNKSTIQMADDAENMDFIAHPCCTSKLDDDWFGELDSSLNTWWCIPMALTLVLIPFYMIFTFDLFKIHFKRQDEHDVRKEDEHEGKQENKCLESTATWRHKLSYFLTAPVTKFWIYTISYVAFLLVYTYVLLFAFDQHLQPLDVVLLVWIVTMVFEEVRVIVPTERGEKWKKAFSKWFKDKWNKMDIVMLTIAIIGFALQWNDTTHEWARTLYAANSFIFFTRLLRSFAMSERLGPKMVMIQRMIVEMLLFLSVLVVFLVSYGVASQALLYPNQKPSAKAIERIFFMPYFQIYGELFLDETVHGKCEPEGTEMCPKQHWLIPIMLGIYLLLGNVLLLNLLIAIFSSVYEEIKCNSEKIWKYEYFSLVNEMKERPVLPPPLILVEHIYRMGRWLVRCFFGTYHSSSIEQTFTIDQAHLTLFEQDCAAHFMRKQRKGKRAKVTDELSSE